jgi:hypothetical protein
MEIPVTKLSNLMLVLGLTACATGCATLHGMSHALGGDRTVGVTNALSVPICQIDVIYGGKNAHASLRENLSSLSEMQEPIAPGAQAFAVLPDFDRTQITTFDLAVHACTSPSSAGRDAADQVLTTVAGLQSSDIPRFRNEPIGVH